jgi:hypothetical protein
MRFTQFGHQVPRKNSTTTGPRSRSFASDTSPMPFAEAREKSGARSPTFSVALCCAMASNVDQRKNRGNNRQGSAKSMADGRGPIQSGRAAELMRSPQFDHQPPASL